MNFLKKSLYILAAGVVPFVACSNSDDDTAPVVKPSKEEITNPVKVLVTTQYQTQDLDWYGVDFGTADNLAPTNIVIDPAIRYQEIDGFGAAITGSTSYNLLQMSATDRKAFLEETFSPDKFGFSYVRISIGCSDFSLSEYTCCDTEGIENFALTDEETDYVIPVLKEILAINPSLKIMGTPWTAPQWMKVNDLTSLEPCNTWTSGHLNPNHYSTYATYFVKWIQAFQAEGIKIYSITPQNEPLNRGNSASMYMSWEEEKEFVKVLGPALRNAGLDLKIYAFDHNYNYDNIASENDYPIHIYEDADASQYLAGAAYHNYGGTRDELLDIYNKAPEKELVFSETSIGTWNDGRSLPTRFIDDMTEVGLGVVNNWCRGSIMWNLMLDSDLGPNREGGCQTCYGAVDIDNRNYKTITRNSHYYVMAHMGAVVKTGATRIGSSGIDDSNVMYAAFDNPDGTYGLVVMNANEKKKLVTVTIGEKHFSYEVPGRGVASFTWAK